MLIQTVQQACCNCHLVHGAIQQIQAAPPIRIIVDGLPPQPALHGWEWWKAQMPNGIALIAAASAFGAAWFAKNTQRVMEKQLNREEELKSPVIEANNFFEVRLEDKLQSLQFHLNNSNNISLSKISYAIIIYNRFNQRLSAFNSRALPEGDNIGNAIPVSIGIENVSSQDDKYLIVAIYSTAIDIRKRKSIDREIYYQLLPDFFSHSDSVKKPMATILSDTTVSLEIRHQILTYCSKNNINSLTKQYFPFSQSEIDDTITANEFIALMEEADTGKMK